MQEKIKNQSVSANALQRKKRSQDSINRENTIQSKQGSLPTIQAKQRPIQAKQTTIHSRHSPIQRKVSKSTIIAQTMGTQYGIDTSSLEFHHGSSFPGKVGAEATIQGNKIDFAPGKDTEYNIKHEIGHYIINTQRGTPPKADKTVNGQAINTIDEQAADKIADTPLQKKATNGTVQTCSPLHTKLSENLSHFPVQRVIDTSTFKKSEHHRYLIDPANTNILYSYRDTLPPEPLELYHKTQDLEKTSQRKLYIWTPNTRFLGKKEKNILERGNRVEKGAYQQNKFLKSANLDVNALQNNLENVEPSITLPATIGMFGKNDCGKFATQLQELIIYKKMMEQNEGVSIGKKQIQNSVSQLNNEEAALNVGDQILHRYPNRESCSHHAATTVAKDGETLITLEAHVGKDLKHPQFHMRNGVKGFVEDNNTKVSKSFFGKEKRKNRKLGDDVLLTKYEDKLKDESDSKEVIRLRNSLQASQESYHMMKEENFDKNSNASDSDDYQHLAQYGMTHNLGLTFTNSKKLQNIIEDIKTGLNSNSSSKQVSNDIEVIKQARKYLNEQKNNDSLPI